MYESAEPLLDKNSVSKKGCCQITMICFCICTTILCILVTTATVIFIAVAIVKKNNDISTHKIVIGLSTFRLNENHTGDFNTSDYTFDDLEYIDAIQKAGATPISLPVLTNLSIDLIERQLDLIDALSIPGGYDITPSLYGEDPTSFIGTTNYATDIYMLQLIKSAYARGIPILGTCRGMQMINVAFGGTLFQDLSLTPMKLPSRKHYQTDDGCIPNHTININKDTVLAEIFPNTPSMNVNSFHHQCIDKVADGFVIDAMSPDGIIEAFHKKDGGFVFGVQFHPEMFLVCSNSFLPVYQRLVEEAKKYARTK